MLEPALVFVSTTTVVDAVAQLDRYPGFLHIVVCVDRAAGAPLYFALPVHRFRWLVEDAPEDTLDRALALEESASSPTRDVNELGDSEPDEKTVLVVLDGEQVIGVAVPAAETVGDAHRAGRPGVPASQVAPLPPALPAEMRQTIIPVVFGTDRASSDAGSPTRFFTGARGTLTFGVADVSIPAGHERGELESPTWWKLEFSADPRKHVAVVAVVTASRDEFVARARDIIRDAPVHDAMVFVHGYNVTFENAARRTAQLAHDLRFRGLAAMYSWPSMGGTLKYVEDETNARWTVPHFRTFLSLVQGELGAGAVHVIAHSMGTRVVTEALGGYEAPAHGAPLRQLVLAAPDIDADTFAEFAREFQPTAERVTLYASSNDLALRASKLVHGYPRAGDTEPTLVIADGIDTIDASKVKTDLLAHSYVGDATSMLADVHTLFETGQPPDERRFFLEAREQGGQRYWFMNARS